MELSTELQKRTDSGHKDWVDGVLLQAQTNFSARAGEL